MRKIALGLLAGIPTYAFVGALDLGMTQGAERAVAANRIPTVAVAQSDVVALPRVVVVAKRGEAFAAR